MLIHVAPLRSWVSLFDFLDEKYLVVLLYKGDTYYMVYTKIIFNFSILYLKKLVDVFN